MKPLEIVVGLVALAGLGVGGWFAWKKLRPAAAPPLPAPPQVRIQVPGQVAPGGGQPFAYTDSSNYYWTPPAVPPAAQANLQNTVGSIVGTINDVVGTVNQLGNLFQNFGFDF